MAVKELLDKRSQNTSARMDMFLSEFGGHNQILMRSNDETWRRQRRMYHQNLNSQQADIYVPYQSFETTQLLRDILHSPEKFEDHIKRYTTSVGYTIAYGMRVRSIEEKKAARTLFEVRTENIACSAASLTNEHGIFRILPNYVIPFLKEIERLNRVESDLWDEQYQICRRRIESGHVRPSFCRDMIVTNTVKADYLSERELKFNAGHAWAGASDTQFNTLWFFVKQAMILYPECQKRAQEEIDSVVGASALPQWSDWAALRYTRSILKETLRFYPATITGGMPHAVTKDDTYLGYIIPAGAGLVNNVWTLNNRVENPRKFDPSRHIDDSRSTMESAIQADATKRDHFTFGAGRRICPGTHVADRGLFIAISRLLWAFNFERILGEALEQDDFEPGFITSPRPFRCKITCRNEAKRTRISEIWEQSQNFLDENGDYIQEFYDRMVRGQAVTA
ncbi:uncharacterized protein Z519_08667 [Cladophialophora bantiana CBS 173.52]|uniref:Cytochrome P450 n=1 Tax=Cladophialophora bantiana (strain ATCC 10958 / CBS 173.52 / CDC B-1940 / NIH 8579) TaxID=1442370 RepID=A0A0D2I1X0_CLAB1|nr:uncharacterized protein Z519_08667 [Cladophialophora bantiana CBS 173.52]KIW90884.1 hypothetical protein Z519_08667 [Cladophialophora bantiana CBS 173.52]